MALLEMLQAAAVEKYGPGVVVKTDPERGVWLDGLKGEAVAAQTLRHMAKLLGVSARPLSPQTAATMLGLASVHNLTRFMRTRGIPYRIVNRKAVVYSHDLKRWMGRTAFDRQHTRRMSVSHTNGAAKRRKPDAVTEAKRIAALTVTVKEAAPARAYIINVITMLEARRDKITAAIEMLREL